VGLQQLIVNRIMDRLADALLALDSTQGRADKRLDNFHVIDTRNTLIPANPADIGNSNDWLNEIHPNFDGYRKIADKLSAGINSVLLRGVQ
jgi:lysophospholipase L1-like esterase